MSQTPFSISEAKRSLGRQLRTIDGFVGIGVDDGNIRVYVADSAAPVAAHFRANFGDSYSGYPVSLVLSPEFRAQGKRQHR